MLNVYHGLQLLARAKIMSQVTGSTSLFLSIKILFTVKDIVTCSKKQSFLERTPFVPITHLFMENRLTLKYPKKMRKKSTTHKWIEIMKGKVKKQNSKKIVYSVVFSPC